MKTCMNCMFNCPAADRETCERFKDKALYGKDIKKYKIFSTDSIMTLANEELIGEANTLHEIQNIIKTWRGKPDGYWRYCLAENATFIDYGSWSKFIAIIPPVPSQELMGDS